MEVLEAIKGRRSVRSFEDRPVEKEVLVLLMEAGVWAPSGGNAQTWRFVLVTDKETLRKIKMVSPGLLGRPPAVIVICQDVKEALQKGGTMGSETLTKMDSAMCAQNIMLTAHSLDLGTCVIASFHPKAVQELLSLPAETVPQLLVSVGYPKRVPSAPKRKTEGIYFFEEYHG